MARLVAVGSTNASNTVRTVDDCSSQLNDNVNACERATVQGGKSERGQQKHEINCFAVRFDCYYSCF